MRHALLAAILATAPLAMGSEPAPPKQPPVPPAIADPPPALVALGRSLFFDRSLSQPAGTSCASCHDPLRGFAGNHGGKVGVAVGATGALGLRNTPSAAYAAFSPAFAITTDDRGPHAHGGQFWDGRSDTLAQQAQGPLTAAAEMNNPSSAAVAAKVAAAPYAKAFVAQFGTATMSRPDAVLQAVGKAIEAYERSAELRPFTSRYDEFIKGHDTFTAAERRGMNAFFDPARGNCAACHSADRTNPDPKASLFTNRAFIAEGVPRNKAIPANADPAFFDLGLGGPKRSTPAGLPAAAGQFKVPTLRNVALRTAFMHNGVFTTLNDVVAFYATRDIDPQRWYGKDPAFNDLPAAARGNVTHVPPFDRARGDRPRLTPGDIADIVAFLGTLNDAPPITALSAAQ